MEGKEVEWLGRIKHRIQIQFIPRSDALAMQRAATNPCRPVLECTSVDWSVKRSPASLEERYASFGLPLTIWTPEPDDA